MLMQMYNKKCAPNYSRIDEGNGTIETMDAFLSWTKDDTPFQGRDMWLRNVNVFHIREHLYLVIPYGIKLMT